MKNKTLFYTFLLFIQVSSPAGPFPSCTSRTAVFTLRRSSCSTWSCLSISSPATWTARSRSGTSSRPRRSSTFFAQRWDFHCTLIGLHWTTPHPITELRRTLYWATPHPLLSYGTLLLSYAQPFIELRRTQSYRSPHPVFSELRRNLFYWATLHPNTALHRNLKNWAKPQLKPELRRTLPLLQSICSAAMEGQVFERHRDSFVNNNLFG